MAADDVVPEFSDDFVAVAPVKRQGARIKRGTADEHIGMLREDALFNKRQQLRSDTFASPLRSDDDALNVSDEGSLQPDDGKSGQLTVKHGQPSFSGRISNAFQCGRIIPAQGNLRLGGCHQPRTCLSIFLRVQPNALDTHAESGQMTLTSSMTAFSSQSRACST